MKRMNNHLNRHSTSNREHCNYYTTETHARIRIELQINDNALVQNNAEKKSKQKTDERTRFLMSAYWIDENRIQRWTIGLEVLEEILLEFLHSQAEIGDIFHSGHLVTFIIPCAKFYYSLACFTLTCDRFIQLKRAQGSSFSWSEKTSLTRIPRSLCYFPLLGIFY